MGIPTQQPSPVPTPHPTLQPVPFPTPQPSLMPTPEIKCAPYTFPVGVEAGATNGCAQEVTLSRGEKCTLRCKQGLVNLVSERNQIYHSECTTKFIGNASYRKEPEKQG